jgi:hypothetical protein
VSSAILDMMLDLPVPGTPNTNIGTSVSGASMYSDS